VSQKKKQVKVSLSYFLLPMLVVLYSPSVGPSVRQTKDKRSQAARYRRTFDFDVAISPECFKGACDQTHPTFSG